MRPRVGNFSIFNKATRTENSNNLHSSHVKIRLVIIMSRVFICRFVNCRLYYFRARRYKWRNYKQKTPNCNMYIARRKIKNGWVILNHPCTNNIGYTARITLVIPRFTKQHDYILRFTDLYVPIFQHYYAPYIQMSSRVSNPNLLYIYCVDWI